MNIVLVGFSKQSASVLALLISRTYPNSNLSVVERAFCDNLRLCLPPLDSKQQLADAMIINLDGVGMMSFQLQHVANLQQFIGVKTAILVARGDLTLWKNAQILPKDFAIFVNSPYGKQPMSEALERLVTNVAVVKDHRDAFQLPTQHTARQQDELDSPATKGKSLKELSNRDTFLHELLKKHFNIKQLPLLYGMLDLSLYRGALKVMAGSQVVYVDASKNLALVFNMQRLIDYCAVINSFLVSTNIVSVEEISGEYFDTVANNPVSGYSKYALTTFLWQIYSCVLPERVAVPPHELLLKMRFMPNFGQMNGVPEYVRHTVSACLVSPHSLEDLKRDVQGADEGLFNRVFLLAILSGTADVQILKKSYESQVLAKKQATTPNKSVEIAQKTGFFRRFLNKLTNRH